ARRRLRADRGLGDHRRGRRSGRPGDQRAILAGARSRDRDGLGAEPAGARWGHGGDLRPGPHDAGAHPDAAVLRPGGGGIEVVSALAFLSPAASDDAVARSPMERLARQSGARFEVRDGWNVAGDYKGSRSDAVSWADVSHLRKFELQGAGVPGEFGRAVRDGDRWVCRLTETRTLVIGGEHPPDDAIDVTCNYAALTILG